jgi:hypothetical protein
MVAITLIITAIPFQTFCGLGSQPTEPPGAFNVDINCVPGVLSIQSAYPHSRLCLPRFQLGTRLGTLLRVSRRLWLAGSTAHSLNAIATRAKKSVFLWFSRHNRRIPGMSVWAFPWPGRASSGVRYFYSIESGVPCLAKSRRASLACGAVRQLPRTCSLCGKVPPAVNPRPTNKPRDTQI